ncbi:hypothetical protein N5P37_005873 [Trichoderma harzianum]|nr:hypothetical protein N5P37_005873 [Trichoderma harzianum]
MGAQSAIETKTHNEYTVGWVCALPKEQTAATAMLDQRHDNLPKPANDSNTYTLGSIGKHNVVIACLPKGHIGNSPAATVAAQMVTTFPSVRFGLMVGIGGGMPPKVRLGDVVVSTPVGSFPGVVQWDLGKAKDGGFERTGSLNNPPASLLTALAKLETEHELVGSQIPEYLDQMKQKWPRLAAKYLNSDSLEDILFKADYSHVCQSTTEDHVSSGILTEVSSTKVVVSNLKSNLDNDMDFRILEWVTPINYGPQQSDFLRRREPGTGQWLIDSREYQAWLGARKQTLFCPGIPGAGKTILTSIVVDHLERTYRTDPTIRIAYIYCNYRRQEEQSIEKLLGSLLKQLSQGENCIPNCLRGFYKQHLEKRTQLSLLEIQTALQSAAENYSTVFIVIDALDECQNLDGSRQKLLTELFSLQEKSGCNLFMTSRVIPEIVDRFNETSMLLEIRASTEDIETYLKGNTGQLPVFVQQSQGLQQMIAAEISKAVDGMFLLAQIYLNSLNDKMTPKAMKNALKGFYKPISGLDEAEKTGVLAQAYEQAMLRINGQQSGFKELAHKVLLWIVCAERQLRTTELQHALAVEIDESEIDKENLPSIQDMVSVCAGLVTVDYESSIIRLVHYTTQEYFGQTRKRWFPDSDIIMTDICASYLLFKAFEKGDCQPEDFLERLKLYPLYIYAAQNWGHHARKASKPSHRVMEFLECETKMNASIQVLSFGASRLENLSSGKQSPAFGMTGLHLGAYFGIEETVKTLLKKPINVNKEDENRSTPLSWSAGQGHENVVGLLLAIPSIEVNSRNKDGCTPLSLAARNGHEAVVRLLLAMPSIDINSRDSLDGTPLLWAASNGHDAVVKLLLSAGVDPNLSYGKQTPLSRAAEGGHEAVVKLLLAMPNIDIHSSTPLNGAVDKRHAAVGKLLLATGADPDPRRSHYTPLRFAARNGDVSITKLLLAAGADPNPSPGQYGAAPLLSAAVRGHDAVVKLLLAAGADVNPSPDDTFTRSALRSAAIEGHEAVVELLLAAGADPNLSDQSGAAPLLSAADRGHKAVVELLLAAGADLDTRDNTGAAPLLNAAARGHKATVELLLAAGADLNTRDNTGQTPLLHTVKGEHEVVAKLLLAAGADPALGDNDGETSLHIAASRGLETTVEHLLAAGANPQLENKQGQTPLFHAAKEGHKVVVELLLKAGARPDARDKRGQTPLHITARKGHGAVMELLLATGVNPDLRGRYGTTPLYIAVWNGYKEVVKLLLAAGADPERGDKYGLTPLSTAQGQGHEEVVALLSNKLAKVDLADKGIMTRPSASVESESKRGNDEVE